MVQRPRSKLGKVCAVSDSETVKGSYDLLHAYRSRLGLRKILPHVSLSGPEE